MMSSDTASSETGVSSRGSSPTDLSVRVKRRPIPRKGHRKSRNGCLSCKRRKVKCDEVMPRCGICTRLKLTCVFDEKRSNAPAGGALRPPQAPPRSLTTDPSWFNISDIRFLQHFMSSAYPTLPLDGWVVWQGVSQMSHEYEFLVHAMLGLGASHLNLLLQGSYAEAAVKHRVIAMKGLNTFLSNAHLSLHNADAAFAATLILAFQSYQMEDGLVDFLTMIRGCHLVGVHALADFDNSLFRTFEREMYLKSVGNLIQPETISDNFGPTLAQGFCDNTKKLAPLCKSVQDLEYLGLLQRVATATINDPLQAHHDHTMLYDKLGSFTPEEFAHFVDPRNYTAQLLILHMLLLDYIMDASLDGMTKASTNRPQNKIDFHKFILLSWSEKIVEGLPAAYVACAEWPIHHARQLCLGDTSELYLPKETGEEGNQPFTLEMFEHLY
ncbi:hypothetical protein VHEMI06922 [[Torrubiella] hemipterigena]|uniref:Zn(2)-C6 fungal-type domain-containing protein n=1 Tax=[Torrubiella] hemipterigena TaxID=1531966 RepID=A0A0A1TM12_9HYPO|nr:hypothetical protein VHEMI06922 [[Torrubiella] hemipterigena]